jgi:Ni,Fe-hydrogenase III large subunit/Ni,Fe-hydrogenase III component G
VVIERKLDGMDTAGIILDIKKNFPVAAALDMREVYKDEIHIQAGPREFRDVCYGLHKMLRAPVMMLFGTDERRHGRGYGIRCVYLSVKHRAWIVVAHQMSSENPRFESLARSVHSASLFEREMREMFGIEPKGHPDPRRLSLHDEVWPEGYYPLRKDAEAPGPGPRGAYRFDRVEGDGIFEVPVGPVHAGIIGPGHFRFSAAGEPIINLEIRLGFAHRGAEKLFEGRRADEAVRLAEVVCGDASFAHSLAFAAAAEKICCLQVPRQAEILRAIFLECERLYNHVHVIGGIATDVAFSFPAALAAIIKEDLLQLNEFLCGSRYLKKINVVGGVAVVVGPEKKARFFQVLDKVAEDFQALKKILEDSVSFMDRIDTTGILRRKTAEDLGIVGLVARASGIGVDLRAVFGGVYDEVKFRMAIEQSGDVLARLRVRFSEFSESVRLIKGLAHKLETDKEALVPALLTQGVARSAIGFAESWRGPVLYWVATDGSGVIERCKIVDPSFHNWPGLSYAALGNIIPDFPVCNKSFDLSYAGNDL